MWRCEDFDELRLKPHMRVELVTKKVTEVLFAVKLA